MSELLPAPEEWPELAPAPGSPVWPEEKQRAPRSDRACHARRAFMLTSAPCGMRMLERECERVAAAARRVAGAGLVTGTAGNISARAGELVAITPTGAELGALVASDISVVDLDGAKMHGERPPTSELALHLGVYRRYGAGAVVHAHPRMGTALACVIDELPVVHYQMAQLGGTVRVAPYATFGTSELAELTLDALQGRAAALMANHGAIAHGADLDDAVERSLLLEWACSVYWHAAALGAPRVLDEPQLTAVLRAATARGYTSLTGIDA